MVEPHYAIVATHTVPITKSIHRLIAINIIRRTAKSVVKTLEALLNPRCIVPEHISRETNIYQTDVRFEPVFCELAENILDILDGTILVSHRADFDYRVLKGEFRTIGYKFTSAILCTSKFAQNVLPDLGQYDLEAVYKHSAVSCNPLKSVGEKVLATDHLFRTLYLEKSAADNPKLKIRLPPTVRHHAERYNIQALQQKPGVYYFKDESGNILYIGKAVRLRERVRSHFNDKTKRETDLCAHTFTIDHVHTGSNLVAELLETDEIFKFKPRFNIAQKNSTKPYIITTSENKKGYLKFSIIRKDYSDSVNEVSYNRKSVVKRLKEVCELFNLCPKFCGFHRNLGKCDHTDFTDCTGACIEEEMVETYNLRVKQADKYLNNCFKNFAIKVHGRNTTETGFVLVRDGIYQGYGFLGTSDQIASADDFEHYLKRMAHTYQTSRIIGSFIEKPRNRANILNLDGFGTS